MDSLVHIHKLPKVVWEPTAACGDRHGSIVQHVVLHTWGGRYTTEQAEKISYGGVIAEFKNTANEASSHLVFPGSAVPNEITQMVRLRDYAWTQAAYNPTSVEIECADAIWQGHDPDGLKQLAHITGYLLRLYKLPPVWSHDRGFCRHGDLGTAGGGHTLCPVQIPSAIWREFIHLTKANYKENRYRKTAWLK